MESWLVVLLLAPPAVWLARCLLVFLSGQRVSGACKLCVVVTFVVVIIWPSFRLFVETSGISLLPQSLSAALPDDVGVRFLVAGLVLLVVGALLYLVPWLVRRWDRERYSRQPQYFHGGRLLPLFFPKGRTNDGDIWLEAESGDIDAAADGGGFDAGGGGGDCGGVD